MARNYVCDFKNGKGKIFLNTNAESGFRQDLTLEDLKQLYDRKFKELVDLKILRHSFLNINGNIEHKFNQQD